jgi:hypothetical protein
LLVVAREATLCGGGATRRAGLEEGGSKDDHSCGCTADSVSNRGNIDLNHPATAELHRCGLSHRHRNFGPDADVKIGAKPQVKITANGKNFLRSRALESFEDEYVSQ